MNQYIHHKEVFLPFCVNDPLPATMTNLHSAMPAFIGHQINVAGRMNLHKIIIIIYL